MRPRSLSVWLGRAVALTLVAGALGLACAGCHGRRFPKDFDPEANSSEDKKRSGAQLLVVNKSHTDECSYANQDRTDWYVVTLKGQPGVLDAELQWDNAKSDVMVDVFDEFGKQLSASPTRAAGTTHKSLLTQVEKPGVFYIRVSAPKPDDGTVYTLQAKWDSPPEPTPVVVVEQPVPIVAPPKPPRHREPVEPKEPKEKPAQETIQGHVVSAYREGAVLTLQIDKGTAAGVKVGMSGTVLMGPSGEDPLSGGAFKIVQIVDDTKSLGRCALHTIGKNTRVAITVR